MRILFLLLCASSCFGQLSIRNPAFVAAILKPAAASGPTFPSGARNYWLLGETSGNDRVDVINGDHLVETTAAVGSTTGKAGNAANWPPGTGTLESSVGFGDIGLPISFSFWVNVDNLPVASASILQGNGTGDPYVKINSGGDIVFGNPTDGDQASGSLGALDSWHLITFTMSGGGDTSYYIDGSSLGTVSTSPPDGTSIILGEIATLDAAIDELAIWQRELTAMEVSAIWNGGVGTFGP